MNYRAQTLARLGNLLLRRYGKSCYITAKPTDEVVSPAAVVPVVIGLMAVGYGFYLGISLAILAFVYTGFLLITHAIVTPAPRSTTRVIVGDEKITVRRDEVAFFEARLDELVGIHTAESADGSFTAAEFADGFVLRLGSSDEMPASDVSALLEEGCRQLGFEHEWTRPIPSSGWTTGPITAAA